MPQYFSVGFALIILVRTIQYFAITRYLKRRGIDVRRGWFSIRDWPEWESASFRWAAAYLVVRPLDDSDHFVFLACGLVGYGLVAVKMSEPIHSVERTGDPLLL